MRAFKSRGSLRRRQDAAANRRPRQRAISVIKRQLYDVPFQTLAEATIDANREMQIALKGSDFKEGVANFMEKRPPRFTGK
jgi:enoyl-CoA hydratase/carnithine racemase